MNSLPRLDEDHHVHTGRSDDATGSLDEVLAAAPDAALVVIADHVRRDTPWLAEYVAEVRRAARWSGRHIVCAVEAKVLDTAGRVDVPRLLPGVGRVLIADHRWPGPRGPVLPDEVRAMLATGAVTAGGVVDTLVEALCAAMSRVPGPQLAHPFSLLPKMGITEDAVTAEHVCALAAAVRESGALVEVNEKWRCPSRHVLAALVAEGVPVVAGSDSHEPATVASYDWVARQLAIP